MKRADFIEPTEHSVICNIHFLPDCYEKKFHGANGSERAKATNYCETRKRPIQNEGSEQPEMADSADNRPRRSRAVQKLEVNRVGSQPFYLLFFATEMMNLFIR